MATELAPFLSFTPEGLLGLVVVMMLFGYLVPLRVVRGRLADKDKIIADQARTIERLSSNNDQLLRGNTTAVQILESTAETVGGNNAEVV